MATRTETDPLLRDIRRAAAQGKMSRLDTNLLRTLIGVAEEGLIRWRDTQDVPEVIALLKAELAAREKLDQEVAKASLRRKVKGGERG